MIGRFRLPETETEPRLRRCCASWRIPWFRFALSLLGNAEQARDATQETGLRFMKALPAFRGDSQLQTWSLGIALNVVREMHRKSRPIPRAARIPRPPPARANPFRLTRRPTSPSSERSCIHVCLADLPERRREAIVLRFFEELQRRGNRQRADEVRRRDRQGNRPPGAAIDAAKIAPLVFAR